MAIRQRKYPKEEVADRGSVIYQQRIRANVEKTHLGRIVAIDIDTGEYEIADDILTASQALVDRLPEAQIWVEKIGYRAVRRF